MKAVSTKLTAADKKADGYIDGPGASSGPDYPWGMRLRFDGALMAKLGMTDLPKVGDAVPIFGCMRVCETFSRDSDGGDATQGFECVVEEIGLGDEDEVGEPSKSAADVLFGKA